MAPAENVADVPDHEIFLVFQLHYTDGVFVKMESKHADKRLEAAKALLQAHIAVLLAIMGIPSEPPSTVNPDIPCRGKVKRNARR